MQEIFNEFSKTILIYIGIETQMDKYEKNIELKYLSPFPVKVMMEDLVGSQTIWKIPGIQVSKAKEMIVSKRHRSLIEQSQKITIPGDDTVYVGWRDNAGSKLQIREIDEDYIKFLIYSK